MLSFLIVIFALLGLSQAFFGNVAPRLTILSRAGGKKTCLAPLAMVTAQSVVDTRGAGKYINCGKPIFVAGGSRGLGLEVIKLLVGSGNQVNALVRRQESADLLKSLSPLVKPTIGDAMNEADVQACMEGCVAAVTTLGGKPEAEGKARVDYVGNSNVIEQAGILGCERIVLVTSLGCGNTREAVSDSVYNVLKDALVAKDKAERDLRMYTNLDWTIIRPGGLKSDAATGKGVLTADNKAAGVINRADVAQLILACLASKGKATQKELTAVDPSQKSDYSKDDYAVAPFEV